jgi:hypothetical protein
MQERARLWFISRWVGDVVVAGLMKKAARCRRSRRRSTPCSVPAPLRRSERYSLPPRRERPPVLAHRWRHGRWLPLLRSSSPFPTSPALLLSGGAPRIGKTPMRLGCERNPTPRKSRRVVKVLRRGKEPRCSRIGRPSELGNVAGPQWPPPRLPCHRQGQ